MYFQGPSSRKFLLRKLKPVVRIKNLQAILTKISTHKP